MTSEDLTRFASLDYDGFRRLAKDPSLSPHEKIGFPDSYRAGKEEAIFADILSRLSNLAREDQLVVDIGPGCSGLPTLVMDHAAAHRHKLVLIDSSEMLDQLPDMPQVTKIAGRFPQENREFLAQLRGRVNAVLCYSVFHYVFSEGYSWQFIDEALGLLADGGELLLGDIPNISKRKRFFASAGGVRFHQEFMHTSEKPEVTFNNPEPGQIDDAVLLGLIQRARAAGFDAYWLPQSAECPMANRREDLLFRRP
jgi:hypothetical protein